MVVAVVVAAAVVAAEDRFGLGWRGPLAAGILSSLDQLDCLEVIAEQYVHLPTQQQRALKYLSRQIPISLHGVSLGLAGGTPPPQWRVDNLLRAADDLQAETISEHLAFVRAAPVQPDDLRSQQALEIGHLAAPPRNRTSIEKACENIHNLQRQCNRPLLVENIPSLITPLGSHLEETPWLRHILQQSKAPLLLDLENLYANAVNRGENPAELLCELPLQQVHTVHLSGGAWVDVPCGNLNQRRFLDDHRHDIAPEVFDLLTQLAARAPQNLKVIIERDGNYPTMDKLLEQIAQARTAVALGRQNPQAFNAPSLLSCAAACPSTHAENNRIEYLLAKLFCDAQQRQLFFSNPLDLLKPLKLEHLAAEINTLDYPGLILMARSVAAKNHTQISAQKNPMEIFES